MDHEEARRPDLHVPPSARRTRNTDARDTLTKPIPGEPAVLFLAMLGEMHFKTEALGYLVDETKGGEKDRSEEAV